MFIQLIVGNKASTEFNIPWAQLLLVQTAVLIRLQSRLLVTTSREYRHKCFPMMYNSGKIATLFSRMLYTMVMWQVSTPVLLHVNCSESIVNEFRQVGCIYMMFLNQHADRKFHHAI